MHTATPVESMTLDETLKRIDELKQQLLTIKKAIKAHKKYAKKLITRI